MDRRNYLVAACQIDPEARDAYHEYPTRVGPRGTSPPASPSSWMRSQANLPEVVSESLVDLAMACTAEACGMLDKPLLRAGKDTACGQHVDQGLAACLRDI